MSATDTMNANDEQNQALINFPASTNQALSGAAAEGTAVNQQ